MAAPYVDGPILAAAVFEPNVFIAAGAGIAALNLLFDRRRRIDAIDGGTGIAPRSLVVVTATSVHVFDAYLLGTWQVTQPLVEWDRSTIVVRAGPLATAYNPLRPHDPEQGHWPALHIEDRAGTCLADLQPYGWAAEHKQVFEVLTGFPGWPPGSIHPVSRRLTLQRVLILAVVIAGVVTWRVHDSEGTTTDHVIAGVIITGLLLIPLVIAYLKQE